MKESKKFTWHEVGLHNTEEDIWVVIGDYVYDLSEYRK